MATAKVLPGYSGILSAGGGTYVRCTSFNVNSFQDAQFFNHVIGLNDTIPSGSTTKGESPGTPQTQRRLWRPSVIRIGGSFSFPATENSLSVFFKEAKSGAYLGDLNYAYNCTDGTKFKECRVNSYDFSVQAGDMVNVSVDIAAKDEVDGDGATSYTTEEKFITWDKVTVSTSIGLKNIRGVSFKINNNVNPVYTCGKAGATLLPYDLRAGMQEVTGSVSCYLKQGQIFMPTTGGAGNLTINAGTTFSANMQVVYFTSQLEGAVGPTVCELPFCGIGTTFT